MILKIFKNTLKSLRIDDNGNKKKFPIKYFFFIYVTPIITIVLVYLNREKKFIDNPTIFASLLSLFIGLIFGVLMKIPDKLSDLKVKSEDSLAIENRKNQAYNFLISYRDYLSFTILLAILIITLIVINNFFPGLTSLNIVSYYKKINWLSYKECIEPYYFILMLLYRYILVWGIINFIFYLILTVSNLYEFIIYEFKKNYD
ncbi:hypothetical protein BAX97_06520 [Elizabethkingia meningoseptica]|uniref:hypothetical protein n=1 Tax=Elizabethkingia meningoseptica TaxID=238 RepID=UPI000998F297|nr:hypothetical protein [Elizabethkingia meningoseptica]OPC28708.1 hypothetical protein BAX97_06520 [Elizabethkingia meningoseptica]